ncbi:MAG: dihydroorotase, partial [Myxococcota bacterium]
MTNASEVNTLTVRGGVLALPTGRVQADLQIVDGRIAAIGQVPDAGGEVIDASGLLVMPGVVDPQVHFRDPGLTHKEDLKTGSEACAAGGITSFLEMPNTKPSTTTHEAMAAKKARAAEASVVNYNFFIGATADNIDVLNDVKNVCGIKIFMGASTGDLLVSDPDDLERIFANGTRLIAVHAEDEARLKARKAEFAHRTDPAAHYEIRDVTAAVNASVLALGLSEKYDRRLHILHMSTGDEVTLLRERGKGGGRVTTETLPQYLLLNGPEIYEAIGTRAQMNPPIRTKEHQEALWRGLHDGTIECIATDHAPHTREEKSQPFGKAPSGMPGVETSLAVMLDAAHRGLCSVEQVVKWMCSEPARIYGMQGKGRLEVGQDGDLAFVDLQRTEAVGARGYFSKVGWSPFEGRKVTGWPVITVVGGRVVFRDNQIQPGICGR